MTGRSYRIAIPAVVGLLTAAAFAAPAGAARSSRRTASSAPSFRGAVRCPSENHLEAGLGVQDFCAAARRAQP